MKHLKMSIMLLLTVVFFTNCEKETILTENAEIDIQTSEIKGLSARLAGDPFLEFDLFALEEGSISLFDYYPLTDEIDLDSEFMDDHVGDEFETEYYGFDYNMADGLIYMLAGEEESRNLYTYDIDADELIALIGGPIVSNGGNPAPTDLTFDADGNLYFAFKNGEVNLYDKDLDECLGFAEIDVDHGSVGLTYDYDNDRLIYLMGEKRNGSNYFYEIGTVSNEGDATELLEISDADISNSINKAIEYVGYNKVITFGDWDDGDNLMKTIDLTTGAMTELGIHHGSSINDFMFIYTNDFDNDGVLNEDDPYPHSNMSEEISINGCYPGVANVFAEPGTTMMDQIDELIAEINEQYDGGNWYYLHKDFTRGLPRITYYWRKDLLITRGELSAISRCARNADVPYSEYDED